MGNFSELTDYERETIARLIVEGDGGGYFIAENGDRVSWKIEVSIWC